MPLQLTQSAMNFSFLYVTTAMEDPSNPVVPNLFSVVDPSHDLAESCGPLNKTS